MLGTPPSPHLTEFLTHACENITFLQLLLWAVKTEPHSYTIKGRIQDFSQERRQLTGIGRGGREGRQNTILQFFLNNCMKSRTFLSGRGDGGTRSATAIVLRTKNDCIQLKLNFNPVDTMQVLYHWYRKRKQTYGDLADLLRRAEDHDSYRKTHSMMFFRAKCGTTLIFRNVSEQ